MSRWQKVIDDDNDDYFDGNDNSDTDDNDSIMISLKVVREDINSKKKFSFGHCPNPLTPPPLTPIRATWSSFLDVKNDVLRV